MAGDGAAQSGSDVLSGTTLKVYRYLYKAGKPVGVHEVQRGVGLQTPSTAHYHLRKLVDSGLVKEVPEGYSVDRVVFESTIRIGGSLIPIQSTFAAFFATTLVLLLTVLRPGQIYATWALAVILDCVSLVVFSFQAVVTYRRTHGLW
ncbi:MAG: winged helix-turn-helix transcriptional regulator [Nitrososphaerota archaeon]|nr:winged helix-turn-helix transcriptional regulator [Nitrososphaerota archaeon]